MPVAEEGPARVDARAAPWATVVVPTRGRPQLLADCLVSLASQLRSPPFEVVVVDDGPENDDTRDAVLSATSGAADAIRYVRQARGGTNAARNHGVEVARGDVICFLDDDVLLPTNWLEEVRAGVLRHPEADCFGGRILLRLEGRPPRTCGRESLSEGEFDPGDEEQETEAVFSGNMAVLRRGLERAGPFDARLPIYGEETEWEVRLRARGGRIVYLPHAFVWHRRTASELALGSMLRRRFRYGYGAAALAARTGARRSALRAVARIPKLVAHGLLRRCWWGAFGAVYQLGYAVGVVRWRRM